MSSTVVEVGRPGVGQIVGGRSGEFIYARWYEPEQLADLDVAGRDHARRCRAAAAARPARRSWRPASTPGVQRRSTRRASCERFEAEQPRTNADDGAAAPTASGSPRCSHADTHRTHRLAELRQIWNTGRYGAPGVMPALNRTIRDADAAEYDRIIDAFRYLCWGDDPDDVRIDRAARRPGVQGRPGSASR